MPTDTAQKKEETFAARISRALQSPETPLSVKWFAFATVLYPFSPLNVIPERILLLGWLDDLFLLTFAALALYHVASVTPVKRATRAKTASKAVRK